MSAAAHNPIDVERLVKLCGMFGSDHVGERANAAALADEMVRQAGLRWPDVILPALPGPTREREIETAADAIAYCLKFAEALTDWEYGFVSSLRAQSRPVTPKQIAVLRQILGKVRRAEARAAA